MPEETKDGQEVELEEEAETLDQPEGEEQPEELSTSEEPAEEELPEGTKERTKEQFDKLKQHNAQLKKELEERQQLPSVVDFLNSPMPEVKQETRERFNPQPTPQATPEPQLVDESGYVNADVLRSELAQARQARQKAEEAEKRAEEAQQRISRFEQDAETKALYQSYPELDPMNESFNREAYDLVRKEITDQIVTTGKRDSMAAAERMSKYFRKPEVKADNSKVKEQRSQVSASGKTSRRQSSETIAELRARHDDQAIAERLSRLGM